MADSTKVDPNKPLAMMTAGELAALLDSRIEAYLEGPTTEPANDAALLDRAGAAKFLRVSVAQIDKFCREKALPFHRVGDCKRFVRDEILAWVKAASK